jgi:hypothetical protein
LVSFESLFGPLNGGKNPLIARSSPPAAKLFALTACRRTLAAMPSCRLPIVLLLALTAQSRQAVALQVDSQEAAPSEYLVAGTVVWAHAGSSSIAICGSGLLGYLRVRVRSYRVKQRTSLLDLRPGDAITAVFSTKDGMLHRLRRVQISAGAVR